jgi:molybdate transport system substrate-binding protein
MNIRAISLLFFLGLFFVAIFSFNYLLFEPDRAEPQKELLIYCGITMIQPVSEIAAIIEQQEDVKISILKGGSGDLLNSVKFNQVGDLYLPGSESYIQRAISEGLVSRTVHVGYNRAAMMVRKGNPKSIPPSLDALKDPNLYVVIGNPSSGSIGKETKKILSTAGIFEEVMGNVKELTTDSKRLISVLKKGEADLIVNWYATSTWKENSPYVDPILIDERLAEKKRLVLGLLTTSKYPDVANKFMDFAASPKGRQIFGRYGLYRFD